MDTASLDTPFPRIASQVRRRKATGAFLAIPATFWLISFFLVPLAIVIVVSFWQRGPRGTLIEEYSLENYEYVEARYQPIIERSLKIAAYTTGICLALGYPLAFFISTRRNPRVRQICLFLVILPFWTNFLIRTYAWQILLGREGLINGMLKTLNMEPIELIFTEKAVMIGLVYGFLPFMVLPIYASVERFNFKLVEAAHDLGANDLRAFFRIVFPLTLPGMIAGCILVFIPSVGAFVTPDLLGGRDGLMIGNRIQYNFRGANGHWPRGAATSIVLMVIVAIGLLIYMTFAERRTTHHPMRRKKRFHELKTFLAKPIDRVFDSISHTQTRFFQLNQPWQIRFDLGMRKIGKIGLWFNPLVCYSFLWLPIFILVAFSFNDSTSIAQWRGFSTRWYENIFKGVMSDDPRFSTELMLNSLQNSLIVSVTATLLSTVIGTMVALSLVRSIFAGKRLLSGMLYMPVAIPEITQGISLLLFFNLVFDFVEKQWLNFFGNTFDLNFGYSTIIIAHVAFNISFVAIVVQARLVDMNPRLEEAARDLGANEWHTFWRVTFPLIFPGVLAGALLAFTLSLDDFVVTFFTKGIGTDTLTVFVYGLLKLGVTPETNAISTLMILVSTLLVALSLALQGRHAS